MTLYDDSMCMRCRAAAPVADGLCADCRAIVLPSIPADVPDDRPLPDLDNPRRINR